VKSEGEVRWLKEVLEKIVEAWDGLEELPEEERCKTHYRVFTLNDLIVTAEIERWSIDVYIVDDRQTLHLSLVSDPDDGWDDINPAINLLEFLLGEGEEDVDHLRAAKEIVDKIAQSGGGK
jgi:hypothetical protein